MTQPDVAGRLRGYQGRFVFRRVLYLGLFGAVLATWPLGPDRTFDPVIWVPILLVVAVAYALVAPRLGSWPFPSKSKPPTDLGQWYAKMIREASYEDRGSVVMRLTSSGIVIAVCVLVGAEVIGGGALDWPMRRTFIGIALLACIHIWELLDRQGERRACDAAGDG